MTRKAESPNLQIDKKDFYLHKTLKTIHARVQSEIQKLAKLNILLVLNTPGSLEHFMIHTDPWYFQEIFYHLLNKALKRTDRGCIESVTLAQEGHPDWSGKTILIVEDAFDNYLLLGTTQLIDTMKRLFQQYERVGQSC